MTQPTPIPATQEVGIGPRVPDPPVIPTQGEFTFQPRPVPSEMPVEDDPLTAQAKDVRLKKAEHALKTERESHAFTTQLLAIRDEEIKQLKVKLEVKGTLEKYLASEKGKPLTLDHVAKVMELQKKEAEATAVAAAAAAPKAPAVPPAQQRPAVAVPRGAWARAVTDNSTPSEAASGWTTVGARGRRQAYKPAPVPQLSTLQKPKTAEERQAETLARYNATLTPEAQAMIDKYKGTSTTYATETEAVPIYVKVDPNPDPEKRLTEKSCKALFATLDWAPAVYDVSQIGKDKNVRLEIWVNPVHVEMALDHIQNILHWQVEKSYDPSLAAPSVRDKREEVAGALANATTRYNRLLRTTESPEVKNAIEARLTLWRAERVTLGCFFSPPVPGRDDFPAGPTTQKRKLSPSADPSSKQANSGRKRNGKTPAQSGGYNFTPDVPAVLQQNSAEASASSSQTTEGGSQAGPPPPLPTPTPTPNAPSTAVEQQGEPGNTGDDNDSMDTGSDEQPSAQSATPAQASWAEQMEAEQASSSANPPAVARLEQ